MPQFFIKTKTVGLNIFQRRKILKKTNTLDLVPYRRHEHEINEKGLVELIVPKFEKKWMRKFFISGWRKDYFKIKLDKLGTETWLAIDGKKNVQEICEELNRKEEKPVEEVEDRVSNFISLLYEQRYISLRQLDDYKK